MKRTTVCAAGFAVLIIWMAAGALAQDFQKTYPLAAGGRISVANVSGDIQVAGYTGAGVMVSAYREGPDREMVEIEDLSTADMVSLKVKYPRNTRCNASVRFVLQVPRESRYRFDALSTASGDVELTDVAGEIRAKSASGNLTLRQVEGTIQASTASGDVLVEQAIGEVKASTASGNVDVELIEVQGGGEMAFSSASGDVTVRAPARLDADVRMSTASGSLKTDFPLTIEEEEGHGKKAYGRLGSGVRPLKLSTASGDVRLLLASR